MMRNVRSSAESKPYPSRAAGDALDGALSGDLAETVESLLPVLERVDRGEWDIRLDGPRSTRELDQAALFRVRLRELFDQLRGRSGASAR